MKENLRLGVILAIITTIAGLLLGIVHEGTKAAIEANSVMTPDQIVAVMPEANKTSKTDKTFEKDSIIQEVLEAYNGDKLVGHLIKVNAKGFHGNIEILVGISTEEKLTGITILSHTETPGVGSRVEKQEFVQKFMNKGLGEALKVVKNSTSSDNEVEGISGASISSGAVVKGVNDAVDYFKANLSSKGGN